MAAIAVVATDRLLLRAWRAGDAALLDRHCNTPAVMRWLGGVQPLDKMVEVVERLGRWQAERGFSFWAVERKSDGEFLGFCGLKLADGEGSSVPGAMEVGWRLREDAWGQGYAKEGAIASLDQAFGVLGADRVVALTVDGNAPSRGLMLRLGMERRADLDYVDPRWPAEMNPVIVYEIGKAAWRS